MFAPITDVVEPAEDPTALHPEIQRQAANIRTDLDRFSPLEISSLVRHGYCVGRKACRAHPDLFGADVAGQGAPGIRARCAYTAPATAGGRLPGQTVRQPAAATVEARTLQASASGASGVPCWTAGTGLPTSTCRSWSRSSSCCPTWSGPTSGPSGSTNSSSRFPRAAGIWRQMSRPARGHPEPWTGETAEEVHQPRRAGLRGFEILQDSRILDMRSWKPGESHGKSDSSSAGVTLIGG